MEDQWDSSGWMEDRIIKSPINEYEVPHKDGRIAKTGSTQKKTIEFGWDCEDY